MGFTVSTWTWFEVVLPFQEWMLFGGVEMRGLLT